MEISTVKDAFDHVVKKRKLSLFQWQEIFDQLIYEAEQVLVKIQSVDDPMVSADPKDIFKDLKGRIKFVTGSSIKQLDELHKELNAMIVKYPNLLERFFHPDISKANRNIVFDFHLVNQILATHFYREGSFGIGDCLIKETGESEATALRSQFFEMHQILKAIRERNLQPALNWASANRLKLKHIGSELELKFRRIQFAEILKGGSRADALNYARTNLAPLAPYHTKGFQKLFVSILWQRKLENCPYISELLAPTDWDKLDKEFVQNFCSHLGQSYKSPLSIVITAGIQSLPTLLKLADVMAVKQEWKAMKQLPVPVDLGNEFQFHSIFVCPVNRDQSTEQNPPMLMPCQHVICKQTITKMCKGGWTFKCPYCPSEASTLQCRPIYF